MSFDYDGPPGTKRFCPNPNEDSYHNPSISHTKVINVRSCHPATTEADLLEALSKFDVVAYATVMPHKKMALVEFETVHGAEKCVNESSRNPIFVRGYQIDCSFSNIHCIQRTGLECEKPNKVLCITILNQTYPIDCDLINRICKDNAKVIRIAIIRKQPIHCLVEFETIEDARRVKIAINGADIYSECCTLKVEYARPDYVKVTYNCIDSWDYTCSLPDRPNFQQKQSAPPHNNQPNYNNHSQSHNNQYDSKRDDKPYHNRGPPHRNEQPYSPPSRDRSHNAYNKPYDNGQNYNSTDRRYSPRRDNYNDQGYRGGGNNIPPPRDYPPREYPNTNYDSRRDSYESRRMNNGPPVEGRYDNRRDNYNNPPTDKMINNYNNRDRREDTRGSYDRRSDSRDGGRYDNYYPPERNRSNFQKVGNDRFTGPLQQHHYDNGYEGKYDQRNDKREDHGCVLMIYGVNHENFNCDKLFNLLCPYGNVLRVKFMRSKPDTCMVEMNNRNEMNNAIKHLHEIKMFGTELALRPSKQNSLKGTDQPFDMLDGTPSYKDFSHNKFQRYNSQEMAVKNRLAYPTPELHWFNAPPDVTDEQIYGAFEEARAPRPVAITKGLSRHGGSSSGTCKFRNSEEAAEALAIANHVPIYTPSSKYPFVLKMAFNAEQAAARRALKREHPDEEDHRGLPPLQPPIPHGQPY
uniref:RRM domain-containing protein n=1 Tax=Strongyloides papillosus TaxID=174720 RepID=A0A0N5BL53_STREA